MGLYSLCIFSSVGPQLSGNPTNKEKVDFSGHDRVSGRFYLRTQRQSTEKTISVHTPGEDRQGEGCAKIQKDRKKENKTKFEEGENKGL